MNKKSFFFKTIRTVAILFVILGIAGFVYIQDYYPADVEAMASYDAGDKQVIMETLENGKMVFMPEDSKVGLIFYPGGKVEYSAYMPLMETLANQGILCILVEMPGNLAVFDMDAADGVQEEFSQITDWYMGGHSLGGAMAASYIGEHTDSFKGLVLLAAYSTVDISTTGLEVLSIYGSEDMVMNREKYEEYKKNLPKDYTETILEGGCHAGFGMYGVQDGDGIPTITGEEQIKVTGEKVAKFIFDKN